MADIEVEKGNTLPPAGVTLYDDPLPGETEGQPFDLTGATVTAIFYDETGAEWVSGAATIDTARPGRVYRSWQNGETDDVRSGIVVFKVENTYGIRTFPDPDDQPITWAVIQRATTALPFPFDLDRIAREYGIGVLTAESRERLAAALQRAINEVTAYLGRPVTPTQYTEPVLEWSDPNAYPPGFNPADDYVSHHPVLQIIDQTYNTDTGYIDLTYKAGLDLFQIPILLDTITRLGVQQYWERLPLSERPVTSISVEGQSETYQGGPGSLKPVDLSVLNNLRDESQVLGPGVYSAPRPHDPYARLDNYGGLSRDTDAEFYGSGRMYGMWPE